MLCKPNPLTIKIGNVSLPGLRKNSCHSQSKGAQRKSALFREDMETEAHCQRKTVQGYSVSQTEQRAISL